MVNYKNGKIYKIVTNDIDTNECYIGSTCRDRLSNRMANHRREYKRWKDGKAGKISSINLFEKYGVENCKIVLIELYPCDSNDELRMREEYWRKVNIGGAVNKVRCHITKDEVLKNKKKYRGDNKNKIHQYDKKWRSENKDKVSKRMLIYRENNKDKIAKQSKKWRSENKDKVKQFYEKRKIKSKEKIRCECGAIISIQCMSKHKKRQIHILALQ